MIKNKTVFIIFLTIFFFTSCNFQAEKSETPENGIFVTDSLGNSFSIPKNPNVVVCYGSFTECWLLSGGSVIGTTDDAVYDRCFDLEKNIPIIGTVKDINLEKIVSLNPDYIILSADIANQLALKESFDSLNLKYGYFRVDNFDDYDRMMKAFCMINGRQEVYEKNVSDVERRIEKIKKDVLLKEKKTYILMRVYSTGIKVKADDIADSILKDLGAVSIVDDNPSLLTDLSVEKVIQSDPDFIFVSTMGDSDAAQAYFEYNILNNPAWQELKAIKQGNYRILPKDLFHYKPNNRWGKSYEYISNVLYPELLNGKE